MIFIIALSLMGSVVNSEETSEFILPTNFKPVSYELYVVTHLEDKFMFEGVVCIRMTCVEATDTIVLHSNSLNIDTKSVVVANSGENIIPVSHVSFDSNNEFMLVKSTVSFKPCDEYVLTIPFTGNITDNLVGYYRSSYVDKENNQTKWLAITQFEPADARRAFPCFDEPAYKATFKIRLGHKKGLTSASNMKLINQINCPSESDYVIDEFEESVLMSTYLVAYMVSDFVYTEANDENDQVKFRVISRKDVVKQTELAINLGPKILKYYEDYFDEKFPLHKLDLVAIPDFSEGTMENWGLVIISESYLLIDLDEAEIYYLHEVAKFMAHELAHQWFGNLVTMKWWTDLWLNEAFAKYLETRGVDFMYPEWNSFQVDTIRKFLRILDLDSLQTSHPVSATIGYPDEISIFDEISFTKGSYLLHMMNEFLGEDTFKRGIRNYIHKYKFSNAEQDDLWSSLTEEAHRQGTLDKDITVKQIMDTWTLQTGYPVLKVVRDYSAGTVTLSQKKHLIYKSNDTDDKSCWWIPITMITSGGINQTNTKCWLNCENNNLNTPLAKDNEWVIYNMQITGLFRVLYDTRNWMAIISTLNDPTKYEIIPVVNRAQLTFDSLSFSHAGNMDFEIAFQLLKYLKHEKEYAPWYAAFYGLGMIHNLLKRTPKYAVFQNYMQRMLSCVYSKFRNMDEKVNGYENIKFKNLVISKACIHQTKDCTQQALDLFRKWMKITDPDNNNILPIELRSLIYCQAIKYGGVDEWNYLWDRYRRSNSENEKDDMLFALGCSSIKSLLQRFLNWSLDNSIIRKEDSFTVFQSVAINDAGFPVAKEFLYCKIADIFEYYQPEGESLSKYVNYIGFQMKTKEELEELQSFIKKSSGYIKADDYVIKLTIEVITGNIEWILKYYDKIVNYMVQ